MVNPLICYLYLHIMWNKKIIVFFFALAQILFLGHTIIPHQHVENHSQEQSHDHNSHDHSDDTKSSLIHIFCEFSHADNVEDFIGHFYGTNFEKEPTPFQSINQVSVFDDIAKVFLQQKVPEENFNCLSFYIFLPSGLRGPPIPIA